MPEDQALERLREILARPEYQVDRSVPWWHQLLAPVFDLLYSLGARLVQLLFDSASGREGWLGLAVLAACLVLFTLAAVYLLRTLRLGVLRESRLTTATLSERRERSELLWRSAQQLAAAGLFRDAVRALYLSALYALDERALLHVDTALTNREHAHLLARSHLPLADSFTHVVEQYDRVRYGDATVLPETFRDLKDHVARLRSAALQRLTP